MIAPPREGRPKLQSGLMGLGTSMEVVLERKGEGGCTKEWTSSDGLAAEAILERQKLLEGLRRLMLSWPQVPLELQVSSLLEACVYTNHLKKIEAAIAEFYVIVVPISLAVITSEVGNYLHQHKTCKLSVLMRSRAIQFMSSGSIRTEMGRPLWSTKFAPPSPLVPLTSNFPQDELPPLVDESTPLPPSAISGDRSSPALQDDDVLPSVNNDVSRSYAVHLSRMLGTLHSTEYNAAQHTATLHCGHEAPRGITTILVFDTVPQQLQSLKPRDD
ncbi:hypothetical protein BC835DRAFT_1311291 [Cytidiella melzeri]|nr:hypothetical protein BC835DRAFT_1311291 [Cytidiella melzeri]